MNPKTRAEAFETQTIQSSVVRVVLFEDRALVVRTCSAGLGANRNELLVPGLSPFIDDRTVQARITQGEARILGVSLKRRVVAENAAGEEVQTALHREMNEAKSKSFAAQRALDRAKRMETRVAYLASKWAESIAEVPAQISQEERMSVWKAALSAIDREAVQAMDDCIVAHRETMLADELNEQIDARARELGTKMPRYEGSIAVQAERLTDDKGDKNEGADALPVSIEIAYQVPCALWRPEHLAKLVDPDSEEPSIELVSWAAAWQRTGEDWPDIELWFSTARPAQRTDVPLLEDDVLVSRRKSAVEKRRIHVGARQVALHAARDLSGGNAGEMPGVDDGGEPLEFRAKQRVSFLSNGRPIRVELSRRAFPATVERILYPELSEAAHLRASATLAPAGAGPLLAGPLRVSRGQSLVGRSQVGFIGAGEHFYMGFGVDDGIRVRRAVDESRETAAVFGTQKIKRNIRLYLSNLSDEPRKLVVVERIFVSETDEVEVNVFELSSFKLDERDGFARAELVLEPLGTSVLKLGYEIRASNSVVLSI